MLRVLSFPVAICLLALSAWAQTAPATTPTPAKRPTAAKPAAAKPAIPAVPQQLSTLLPGN